jgi:hypothetical protein
MSFVMDDSSSFVMYITVWFGIFQRIPINSQLLSYSSAFMVIMVSDGLFSVHGLRTKSFTARNINQSDVLNCVSFTMLYS